MEFDEFIFWNFLIWITMWMQEFLQDSGSLCMIVIFMRFLDSGHWTAISLILEKAYNWRQLRMEDAGRSL